MMFGSWRGVIRGHGATVLLAVSLLGAGPVKVSFSHAASPTTWATGPF
jgi:hypothetical protein